MLVLDGLVGRYTGGSARAWTLQISMIDSDLIAGCWWGWVVIRDVRCFGVTTSRKLERERQREMRYGGYNMIIWWMMMMW